jgi:GntR family transcriptional repressor for pyruvate dehydrogenase complex
VRARPQNQLAPNSQEETGDTGSGFARVSRGLLSDEVVKEVQRLLATQKLKPGDQLPAERDLAGMLGVSRTVVRDAVQRLAGVGILEIQRGKGTFVRQAQYLGLSGPVVLGPHISREQIELVLEARACLDVYLAGLAAERATKEDLRGLEQHLREVEHGAGAARTRFGPDLDFEALIGKAAGNPILHQLQLQAHAAFAKVWEKIGYIPRTSSERQSQHKHVVAAIKRRDAAAARRAMAAHLDIWDILGKSR